MQKSQRSPQISQNNQQHKVGRFSILQNESSNEKDLMFQEQKTQEDVKNSEESSKNYNDETNKDTSTSPDQKTDLFTVSEGENPFLSSQVADEKQNSLIKNEQMENQAIIEMRKSTGNILQANNQASCVSPFTSCKVLSENNVNNFKPPEKTRTSWAPVNTQTDSKVQIPRLIGLYKIQQSTPSSLREFRSSAPTKLTPRSLFAFRGGGDNSALNQEEEQDSLFIQEKDKKQKVSVVGNNNTSNDEIKDKNANEIEIEKEEEEDEEEEQEGTFLFEDSDHNEEGGSENLNNQSEIFNLFSESQVQIEQQDDDDQQKDQIMEYQKKESLKSEQQKSLSMSQNKQDQKQEEKEILFHVQNQVERPPSQSSKNSTHKIPSNQASKLSSDKNNSAISSEKNLSSHNKSRDSVQKLKTQFQQSFNSSQEKVQQQESQKIGNIEQTQQEFHQTKEIQPSQQICPIQQSKKLELPQSKEEEQIIDEDLLSDVKLLQQIQSKPQIMSQQQFASYLPQHIQDIPMDNEMKTQIMKMKIAQQNVQYMPLDDSFSLLSNQIYKTIEKKKGGVSRFAHLNPKASNFSPQKKQNSNKKVVPTSNNVLGSPLAHALSRTASTTPSDTIIPPPGFVKADQQSPENKGQTKMHQNPTNVQVPSFDYNSPYSPQKPANYQNPYQYSSPPYQYQQQPSSSYVNLNPPQHPFSTPPIQNQVSPPPSFGYGYTHYSPQPTHYQSAQGYNNSPYYSQYYDQGSHQNYPYYNNEYNSPRSPQNHPYPVSPNQINPYQIPPSRGLIPNPGIPQLIGKGSNLPSAQILLQTNAPVAFSDLLDNVLQIAVQQSGYKLIERQLHRIDPHSENGKTLFKKLLPHFDRISNDPLGNFLSQSLIEIYYGQYIRSFYNSLRTNFLSTCQNIHGTRVIQKVISVAHSKQDTIANKQGQNVLDLFKKDISGLIKTISSSPHGNYVIQASLLEFKNDISFTDPIYAELSEACVSLSTHKHGCCVMQKALQQGGPKERKMLANEILNNLQIILPDLYGNYVIQFMIKLKMNETNHRLCEVILQNIVQLSNEKCSSNVVQKCLEHASRQDQDKVVDFITKETGILLELIFNQYGNYVVQKALQVLPRASRRFGLLMHQVKKILPQMRQNATTNSSISQIYGRFLKKYPQLQHCGLQNSKMPGASLAGGGAYHYRNNNNNNYHNRGHSGKKMMPQPFRNGKNIGGYMMSSPKSSNEFSYNQNNFFVNSPPPIAPPPNFDLQQVGNRVNEGYGNEIYSQAKYYNLQGNGSANHMMGDDRRFNN